MLNELRDSLLNGNPILVMLLAAVAALAFFWGLATMLGHAFSPGRRRLHQLAVGGEARPSTTLGEHMAEVIQPIERFVLPQGAERDKTQERLQYAGFRSSWAVSAYYAGKLVLAVGLVLLWLGVTRFLPPMPWGRVVFVGLAAFGLGMLAPGVWLDRRVRKRHQLLRNGFPDALDLLTVCVEAGLGLTQALQRVAEELNVSHPELAGEIGQVTAQMRAGVDRELALKSLATRTGLDDVRGLVSLLAQTLRFGTGISDALRVYSEDFRDRRMQRAEEAAAKIGTKLLFPLVICLFPSFFVVAVGPAAIKLMEAFGAK
jgi:tight adherence protein C